MCSVVWVVVLYSKAKIMGYQTEPSKSDYPKYFEQAKGWMCLGQCFSTQDAAQRFFERQCIKWRKPHLIASMNTGSNNLEAHIFLNENPQQ